jgi:ABC-type enterochelin transport system substrate-binding protein
MKFIADLLLDFIISPYTTDNSRKDTEKEKIEPIAISLDLAEERDNLVQDLVKMIIPVADAFDKFCVKAKEKSFLIDSLLKDREKLKEQLGIKDLLQIP